MSEPGGRVVRARTVKPHPDLWDRPFVDAIIAWPSDPGGLKSGEAMQPPRANTEIPRCPEPREPSPVQKPLVRRLMIRKEDVHRYGATEGCRTCRGIERGVDEVGGSHSEECRARIEKQIREDPTQAHRIRAADARRDEFMAREVERGETRKERPADDKKVEETKVHVEEEAEAEEEEEENEERKVEAEYELPEAKDEEAPEGKRQRVRTNSEATERPERPEEEVRKEESTREEAETDEAWATLPPTKKPRACAVTWDERGSHMKSEFGGHVLSPQMPVFLFLI